MFFLTQEAGANKAIIHLLSLLYCRGEANNGEGEECKEEQCNNWNSEKYAEPLLLERIIDILSHFLKSERAEGRSIDSKIWRRPSDAMGKIALYCTSFAGVVVAILFTLLNLSQHQFSRHIATLFPLLTALVNVQSDEIR
eukprot:814034_1